MSAAMRRPTSSSVRATHSRHAYSALHPLGCAHPDAWVVSVSAMYPERDDSGV